jgi:hypothetical protein
MKRNRDLARFLWQDSRGRREEVRFCVLCKFKKAIECSMPRAMGSLLAVRDEEADSACEYADACE